ncbi:DUF4407 domain-containing protein [Herbiconiux solani]|uniref:DUF4407 domain-containing protein n=1 Tax=Herbiconiux solani TaxID=661329 RepID=UPI0008256305|nr:DUF4407 domain-containing protein [Herbiconiux solani]
MARRYNSNPVSNGMAWLGGARLDVLADAPGDRARFVAMGGVILSTAFLSAVSATFALVMAVGAPLPVAIIVGIFWGVIILNLDRLLIIGMAKQKGVWRNIALAIPRVALALIIGTVISTPLTLQIFAAEINSEIQVMQAEEKAAFEQQIAQDPRFAAIPDLQASIASNQAIVDKGLQTDLSSDPNYAAAVAATAAAQTAYDAAQSAYLAEIDGTGGTGIRGDGAVTQSKLVAVQQAEARLDAAKAAEQTAADAASTNLQASAQSRLDAAKAQLAADQATLASAQSERATEQAAYESAVDNSAGLLSRLQALFRLGEANALLNVAHIMIAALFVCIELLPVIVKVLANLGGQTAYDRLVDVREDGEVSGGEVWAARRAEAISAEASVQVAVAEDRAAQQIEFGKRINQAVLEQQEVVISEALRVWGGYASERAAERMGEWERELEASASGTVDASEPAGAGAGSASDATDSGLAGAAGRSARPGAGGFDFGFGRDETVTRPLGLTGARGVARDADASAEAARAARPGRIGRPGENAWWRRGSGAGSGAGAGAGAGAAAGSGRAGGSTAGAASPADEDATDELSALFADVEADTTTDAPTRDDAASTRGGAGSGAGRTARDREIGEAATRPLPRNTDRAAFLRKAGLPDQL